MGAAARARARAPRGRRYLVKVLPADVREGVRLFNEGRYFDAHEALERAWLDDASPQRNLYQAILQVGVGLHHARNHNRRGALRLLDRGSAGLEPFLSTSCGIDIARLLVDARAARAMFADPRGLDSYDWTNPVRIHPARPVD
jgi:predicted metal-dependent hydrolase